MYLLDTTSYTSALGAHRFSEQEYLDRVYFLNERFDSVGRALINPGIVRMSSIPTRGQSALLF